MEDFTIQELIAIARDKGNGWNVVQSNNEDEVGVGELYIYPSGYKHGNFFYTVFSYPEEYSLYRSFFKSDRSVSDTLLDEYTNFEKLLKAVKRDIKYYK